MRADLVSTDNILVPHILSIGYSDDPAVTRYGPSRRKQYIIHYVISGEGYFNGRLVRSGEGFMIAPELEVEEYHSSPKDPWKFLWVISEDSAMKRYFELHGADKDSGIFKFHNKYVLENVIGELGQNGTIPASSMLLAELFLRIFNSSVTSDARSVGTVARRYLDFSMGYIKSNPHLSISVSELCNILGVSQPYLYKVFKESLNVSPKEYISACKVSEAKRLLSESSLSVSEVASAVGFFDALAFSRFFSKKTGLSPSAFRKSNL